MKGVDAVYINLGCGGVRPDGWQNFDSSLNSLLQSIPVIKHIYQRLHKSVDYELPARYLDLRKKWPFSDRSVSVVYASHLLEHLSQKQAQHFMSEANRVLKPDGTIRIVVPDLRALSANYLSDLKSEKPKASQDFLYAMNLHKENTYSPDSNILSRFVHLIQGHPHQHKYMYDEFSLTKFLLENKFHMVRGKSYGASKYINNITDVECTAEGIPSVYVEAKKI